MAATGNNAVCMCVGEDMVQFLSWSIRQYAGNIELIKCATSESVREILGAKKVDILIVDCQSINQPPLQYLQEMIEANPSLNVLLIVPPTIKKADAVEIISKKLVKGMTVLPFSAEIICNYIGKMVGKNA